MITKQASKTVQSILSTQSRQNLRSASSLTRLSSLAHNDHNLDATKAILNIVTSSSTRSSSWTQQQHQAQKSYMKSSRSFFHTESDYHTAADSTLESIQDTLDYYFEDNPSLTTSTPQPDISYSSGVLTISLLPHGTWVLNKQTPNQQIWWSSPITGPRRYEFDEGEKKWIWTKYVDYSDGNVDGSDCDKNWKDTRYLGEALKKELVDLFLLDEGLNDLDSL